MACICKALLEEHDTDTDGLLEMSGDFGIFGKLKTTAWMSVTDDRYDITIFNEIVNVSGNEVAYWYKRLPIKYCPFCGKALEKGDNE